MSGASGIINQVPVANHNRWFDLKSNAIALYDSIVDSKPMQNTVLKFITTQSAIGSVFNQAQQILEFKLYPKNAGMSIIDNMYLELQVTTPSIAPTMTPTPLWMQRVDVMSSNKVIESWQGRNVYAYIRHTVNQSELQSGYATAINCSTTTLGASGTSYTANTSYYFYIPLRCLFPVYGRNFLKQMSELIEYQFYMQPSSSIIIEGNGASALNLSCTRARLYYWGPQIHPDVELGILNATAGKTTYYHALYPIYYQTPLGNITNTSDSIYQVLNSVNGRINALDIEVINTSGNLAYNSCTPVSISDSSLLNADSSPYDVTNTQDQLRRYLFNNDQRPQSLASNYASIFLPFSENVVDTLRCGDKVDAAGTPTGSKVFTSQEAIKITPSGNVGPCTLYVNGFRMAEAAISPSGILTYTPL